MKQFLLLVLIVTTIASCKKDEVVTTPMTSLTMGNFVIGGKTAKLGGYITTAFPNNSNQFALVAGEQSLYIWPVGDSLKPYFVSSKFSTQNGEVYSLFLHGDTLAPQGIVIKENIPYRTDSTAGIRFINLSPNSTTLNITLSTTPDMNEVTELAYKEYTDFKSYPGLYNSAYKFEVRDAVTHNILTTFSFTASTLPRFANVTLVIRGLVGASPALGVTRMNQDR